MPAARSLACLLYTSITDELRWRGLIYDKTEEIDDLVSRQKITLYLSLIHI